MGKHQSKLRKAGHWIKQTFYKVFGIIFKALKEIQPFLGGKFPALHLVTQGDLYQLRDTAEQVQAEDTLEKVQFVEEDHTRMNDPLLDEMAVMEQAPFEEEEHEFSSAYLLERYKPQLIESVA